MIYFAYSGIGAVSHKMSGVALVRVPGDSTIWGFMGNEETDSKFAITFGGGFVAMTSETVGFEFSAGVDIVFVGTVEREEGYVPYDTMSDVVTAGLFEFKFGLVFLVR
jgi:hypothetical protein